jgi:hypothetical protein
VDAVNKWNPKNETVSLQRYQELCVFDYVRDLDPALRYQQAEVPFIIGNTPEIWRRPNDGTETTTESISTCDGDKKVEHSKNHHSCTGKRDLGNAHRTLEGTDGSKRPSFLFRTGLKRQAPVILTTGIIFALMTMDTGFHI